ITAIGDYIEGRAGHSAVLARDSKILIYGGAKTPKARAVKPDLAMLDLNVYPFKWKILNNSLTLLTSRFTISDKTILNNNTYIFDTLNFKWVNMLDRSISLTVPEIITISIIAIFVLVFFIIVVVILWKHKEGIKNGRLTNF
ncbi:11289_t:CDS:2, partial [Gigaspora margarita]